jgi:hypothetical protein
MAPSWQKWRPSRGGSERSISGAFHASDNSPSRSSYPDTMRAAADENTGCPTPIGIKTEALRARQFTILARAARHRPAGRAESALAMRNPQPARVHLDHPPLQQTSRLNVTI